MVTFYFCQNEEMSEFSKNSSDENISATSIYILPNGFSRKYIQVLSNAALRNNFKIVEKFEIDKPTVIVSNLNDLNQISKILKLNIEEINSIKCVNLKWLTDSNKSGVLCNVLDKNYLIGSTYKITSRDSLNKSTSPKMVDNFNIPDYECQRSTPIEHHNEELTNALEILEEFAYFKGSDVEDSKALAFRKAICVLKCLPVKLKNINQVKSLKNIGEHTKSVIEDILAFGYSKEVDRLLSQDYYHILKQFNSIYGCGSVVSNRLYELGVRDINDLREKYRSKKLQTDFDRLKYGLTYFEDLTINRIDRDECNFIFSTIKSLIHENINSECIIELVGGFKRGKKSGHDIDILISHPVKDQEKELLSKIVELLGKHDWTKYNSKNDAYDLFEKYIGIFKFPIFNKNVNFPEPLSKKLKVDDVNDPEISLDEILSSLDASKFKQRNWIARRIDLIISPIEELPFAILGWTGSRQFLRSMRLYSDKELGFKLSSHGIFDCKNKIFLSAKEEKDIFDLLKLNYLQPSERNC